MTNVGVYCFLTKWDVRSKMVLRSNSGLRQFSERGWRGVAVEKWNSGSLSFWGRRPERLLSRAEPVSCGQARGNADMDCGRVRCILQRISLA